MHGHIFEGACWILLDAAEFAVGDQEQLRKDQGQQQAGHFESFTYANRWVRILNETGPAAACRTLCCRQRRSGSGIEVPPLARRGTRKRFSFSGFNRSAILRTGFSLSRYSVMKKQESLCAWRTPSQPKPQNVRTESSSFPLAFAMGVTRMCQVANSRGIQSILTNNSRIPQAANIETPGNWLLCVDTAHPIQKKMPCTK